MKLEMFIDQLKIAKDKGSFVENHIVKQYVPYESKIALCKKIVDFTMETQSEPKLFNQNTPTRYLLFVINIINEYTDIELDDASKYFEYFNILDEKGLVDAIINCIPEKEYKMFNTVLNMCVDDYLENNRSLVGYLDTKLKALNLSLDAMSESVTQLINGQENLVSSL